LTKAVKENKIFPIDDCESRKSTSLIDLGNKSDSYKMLIGVVAIDVFKYYFIFDIFYAILLQYNILIYSILLPCNLS